MPSIRRTLSPVPRSGTSLNPETGPFGSPLSQSPGSPLPGRIRPPFSASPDSRSALYKLKALILGIAFQRSSHILERPKSRGQAWRNFLFPMTVCFMIGLIIGLAQFVSRNLSMHSAYEHQAFSFQMIPETVKPLIDIRVVKNNDTSDINVGGQDPGTETLVDSQAAKSPVHNSDLMLRRLLIIVTPTHAWPLQAYYLNRLVQTLKLVPPPLLWIVVEMNSQSAETADILRRTGVMYRHLVCNKNLTGSGDRRTHQRNVALSHIETHHLDGVVYFADDDVIYSADLFEEMRQIRLFGTWMVAKLKRGQTDVVPEGPVCSGSHVIGWHADETTRKFWRFHVDISGFAFNSTILWDPNRSVLKPIRQIDAVMQTFQVSSFVRQVVEDETQMECLLQDCSRIMAWHLHL